MEVKAFPNVKCASDKTGKNPSREVMRFSGVIKYQVDQRCGEHSVPSIENESSTGVSGVRLLDQVRGKIRFRHYSIRTGQAYADWIRRFILHFYKHHPHDMGAPGMEAVLCALAMRGPVAASAQNQALPVMLTRPLDRL